MRHKHDPKGIKSLGDQVIEECTICKRRRVVSIPSGSWRTRDHFSRWVTKEESEKFMLSWLWRY